MLLKHQKGEIPVKEIKIPELAESIMEGTIAEWLVNVGDKVEKGDAILELETDKVNVEVHSEFTGIITEVLSEEGEDVEVGDTIGKLTEDLDADVGAASESEPAPAAEETAVPEAKAASEPVAEEVASTSSADVIASPAARKRARELNIDLSQVNPQDPLGRVRPEDVDAAKASIEQQATQQAAKSAKPAAQAEETEFDKPVERIKMSRRRQTIAKRLVEAQHTAAMLTTFNEVDMTAVMDMRKERKDNFLEKNGVKLGFMSFFTKAVVAALKEFPYINAEIQGKEIVLKEYYDIGMAVSAEDGLVVPIVRDADRLDFAGIEREIGNLAGKARDNQLGLDEIQGGTFTITNGGTFGSLLSTPILNAPQVGILGMHNIVKRAMVMPDDSIEARPMMYIALSYDHRIVDGKDAVQFLVRIKDLLEDPFDLLLEG